MTRTFMAGSGVASDRSKYEIFRKAVKIDKIENDTSEASAKVNA